MNDTHLIILMGLAYAIGEALQLIYLAYQQKRTADLIDSILHSEKLAGSILKNGFVGMAKELETDEEAQKAFFSLVGASGQAVLAAADQNKELIAEIVKAGAIGFANSLSKDEEAQKAFFSLIAAMGKVGMESAQAQVTEKIEKKIKTEFPVPKKFRWIYDFLKPKEVAGPQDGPVPINESKTSKLSPI